VVVDDSTIPFSELTIFNKLIKVARIFNIITVTGGRNYEKVWQKKSCLELNIAFNILS